MWKTGQSYSLAGDSTFEKRTNLGSGAKAKGKAKVLKKTPRDNLGAHKVEMISQIQANEFELGDKDDATRRKP